MIYPLTSGQYANFDGKFCPHCGSKHLMATGPVDVGTTKIAYQRVCCQECKKKWWDRYVLEGFMPAIEGASDDRKNGPDA